MNCSHCSATVDINHGGKPVYKLALTAVVCLSLPTPLIAAESWQQVLKEKEGKVYLRLPRTKNRLTDWCSNSEVSPTAHLAVSNYPMGPNHGYTAVFDHFPTRTWCFAKDDHDRSGKCVGLGTNCLQGYLDIEVCCQHDLSISLQWTNQHSHDTRFATMYWE